MAPIVAAAGIDSGSRMRFRAALAHGRRSKSEKYMLMTKGSVTGRIPVGS